MLALPVKRADPCNVGPSLVAFIAKEYPDESNKFESDVSTFQQIRNRAVTASISSDQLGMQHLLQYNFHVKSIAKILSGYESETKFKFTWSDAFRPNNRCSSGSLHYDWTCVLWNMASFESHKASTIDRSTDDGVRQASIHFQQAAGIMEYIRVDITPKVIGPKSPEFGDSFLRMVVGLLLAQAQVCFYEKAVKEKKSGGGMKPAIIAKLAQQVATFYWTSVELCREREVNTAIDPSWVYHMEFQRDSFRAVAEYWQSAAVKEDALNRGSGYGEEVARLRKADQLVAQAIKQGRPKRISLQTVATAEAVQKTIQKALSLAEKDNTTIYHDPVPDYTTLSSVTPVPMVKTAPLPEYYSNDAPLLGGLVPKAVREMSTARQERVDTLLREISGVASTATNEGRASLSRIGLPGSLEVYLTGGELPDSLWKKFAQIQSLGGVNELKNKLQEVDALSDRARNTVDGILNSIKREDNADKAFRQRYPDYSQPPSSRLSSDLLATTQQMLSAHETARQHDASISYNLQDSQFLEQMRILGLSKAEVKDMLPAPSRSSASRCDTSKLEDLLGQIAKLFVTREEVLESLRVKASADCTEAIMEQYSQASASGPLTEETKSALVTSLMSSLDDEVAQIHRSLQKQHEILREVHEENAQFTSSRENDPVTQERDHLMRSFEQAISAYFATHSQLNAGSTFYRDMQSRLTSLMQQCDDLSYTQQLQRQEYEALLISSQDRLSQEQRDHEMALKLAQEMEENMRTATATPPSTPTPNAQYQPQQYQPQPYRQQQQQPQSQQPSYPFSGPASSPSPHNVVYGQPVAGPPGVSQPPAAAPYVYNGGGMASNPAPPPSTAPLYPYPPSAPTNPSTHSQAPPYGYQQTPQAHTQGYQQTPQQQSYPALPGQAPSSSQQHSAIPYTAGASSSASRPVNEGKVVRLMEMGFERNSVVQALTANNDDEEAALNGLLSGSAAVDTPPPATAAAAVPTDGQTKGGGIFGKFWGK